MTLAIYRLAPIALIVLACGLVLWPPRAPRGDLRITFLDVGQGDAAVIETPRGHTIMIDTGGRLERGLTDDGRSVAEAVGERIVVPFLIRHGIHHVDAIVLSHPHGDHAGGLAPILRTLGADIVFDGRQKYGGHAYQDALDEARRKNVAIVHPRAGDLWKTGDGLSLHFLTPSGSPIGAARDIINENSLVVMLECACGTPRPFRILFMGDAGKVAESRLLERGADLGADILKVGHHGSKFASSSEFLTAVGATHAVISDGRRNLYHHPAPRTLEALSHARSRVWRTDRCGAIVVSIARGAITVRPTLPVCLPPSARTLGHARRRSQPWTWSSRAGSRS